MKSPSGVFKQKFTTAIVNNICKKNNVIRLTISNETLNSEMIRFYSIDSFYVTLTLSRNFP